MIPPAFGQVGRSSEPKRPRLVDTTTIVHGGAVATKRPTSFQYGGSQTVKQVREHLLPEGSTELVRRSAGRQLNLEPHQEWPEPFLRCLGSLDEELERPKSQTLSSLSDPFA